jgi:hypothetical protein
VSTEELLVSKLVPLGIRIQKLQLRDVRNLITSECDPGYIERWAGELGVEDLRRECLP